MCSIRFVPAGLEAYSEPVRTGIHAAIALHNLGKVQELVFSGVDVEEKDAYGDTPLGLAVDLGHTDIVEVLLEAGAYPELGSWTSPLEAASINGYVDIARLLINAGSDVNLRLEDGGTALMAAAQRGHLDIVQVLVEAGAEVDIQAVNWGTALSLAAKNNHTNVVDYLLLQSSLKTQDPSVSSITGCETQ